MRLLRRTASVLSKKWPDNSRALSGADPLVRGRRPRRPLRVDSRNLGPPQEAGRGAGCGPGGPPHEDDCTVISWTLHWSSTRRRRRRRSINVRVPRHSPNCHRPAAAKWTDQAKSQLAKEIGLRPIALYNKTPRWVFAARPRLPSKSNQKGAARPQDARLHSR
jgi:hypothetical protein